MAVIRHSFADMTLCLMTSIRSIFLLSIENIFAQIFADMALYLMASVRSMLLLWIGLATSATVLTAIDTTIQPTVQISVDEDYEDGFEEEDGMDIPGKDMVLEAVGKVGRCCKLEHEYVPAIDVQT